MKHLNWWIISLCNEKWWYQIFYMGKFDCAANTAYCVQLIKRKRTLNNIHLALYLVCIALNEFFILYSIFQLKFNLKLVTGNSRELLIVRSKKAMTNMECGLSEQYLHSSMQTLSFCVRCETIRFSRWIYPSAGQPECEKYENTVLKWMKRWNEWRKKSHKNRMFIIQNVNDVMLAICK